MLRYIVFLLLSLTDALIEYHEDVTWELQTSEPPNCQHYPSKAELQGHVDSIYGLVIGEVTSGLPPDMSVSSTECQTYMDSQGVSGTVNSISWAGGVDYPEGCSVTTDGGTFYFNTRGDGNIGICGFSNMHCIQKSYPESSVSCRAYSLQHNYLFWDLVANYAYTEVSSGSPAVEGDALYVTESECEEYAGTIGATWGTFDNSVYPHGCISMSNNRVQWVSSGGGDCNVKTYTGNCIQKTGAYNMLCHLGNTLQ